MFSIYGKHLWKRTILSTPKDFVDKVNDWYTSPVTRPAVKWLPCVWDWKSFFQQHMLALTVSYFYHKPCSLITLLLQGIKKPFGFSIYADATGAINVQPQALRSDDGSKGEPIVLLPTFPDNFPALIVPQPLDPETKKDTLAACRTVANTQAVQDAYEDLFSSWYSADLANHTTQELRSWIEAFGQQGNTDAVPLNIAPRATATLSTSGIASSSHLAYHKGQMVAVRSEDESDSFWIGKISLVQHSGITVRWMEADDNGCYLLMPKDNKGFAPIGAILCANVLFSKNGKLLKKTLTAIKKNI
jgi:hypothetical protein